MLFLALKHVSNNLSIKEYCKIQLKSAGQPVVLMSLLAAGWLEDGDLQCRLQLIPRILITHFCQVHL